MKPHVEYLTPTLYPTLTLKPPNQQSKTKTTNVHFIHLVKQTEAVQNQDPSLNSYMQNSTSCVRKKTRASAEDARSPGAAPRTPGAAPRTPGARERGSRLRAPGPPAPGSLLIPPHHTQ